MHNKKLLYAWKIKELKIISLERLKSGNGTSHTLILMVTKDGYNKQKISYWWEPRKI